jgi:hypothetical protein
MPLVIRSLSMVPSMQLFALFFMVTLKTLNCKSKCCATRVLIIAFVPHPLISLKYHMQLKKPPSV